MVSKSPFCFIVGFLLFCFTAVGAASAQCAAPSTNGIRICFPNEGLTVTYVPPMEMSATVKSGAIRTVKIWDNGTLRDTVPFLPNTIYDASMTNGWNRVTVQVWDTGGNFYQAVRSFYVTGYGVNFCHVPSAPGVNLCWPLEGSLQPNNIPISATARGASKISSLSVYLDGRKVLAASDNYILSGAYSTAGTHRVTVVAHDTTGHTYKSSHTFTAYYEHDCNPKTGVCSPGIVINKPLGAPDVPTSFQFQADVEDNTAPITAMKVYVDGAAKAASSGPGITAQIDLPANSTHIVTVKAWDTQGKIYASSQTYFVH